MSTVMGEETARRAVAAFLGGPVAEPAWTSDAGVGESDGFTVGRFHPSELLPSGQSSLSGHGQGAKPLGTRPDVFSLKRRESVCLPLRHALVLVSGGSRIS